MHKMNELKNDSLGNQIVTEALEWLGTPWFHGQSLKGIGTDCVGFIAGVGIKVGFLPYDFIIENYERIPRNNFLFPFIRFTNWKQVARWDYYARNSRRFHSYASRIGSKFAVITDMITTL